MIAVDSSILVGRMREEPDVMAIRLPADICISSTTAVECAAWCARNLPDGRVEVCAQGERAAIEELEELLREFPSSAGRPGRVQSVVIQWGTPVDHLSGFTER